MKQDLYARGPKGHFVRANVTEIDRAIAIKTAVVGGIWAYNVAVLMAVAVLYFGQ